VPQRSYC